ncbi:hypothetical protein VE02_04253 [Pseudogymnoascus sp. 03VT05]|nr:hypothetical protein VE02_04253 [Pseudogymnoascus sp. 03VT05]
MGDAHTPFVHPESIEAALTDKSIPHDKSFIGGEWVSGSTTFPVYDPATNKIIANIPSLSTEHFTTAIEHAHREFKTFRNTKDLGVLLTMENGKTLAEARGEVEYGATFISWFAEEAVRSYGDIIPSQHKGSTNLVIRQPIGVCGIIAPWNFPIAMITRKIAPAIAAGCTVVVKPPSETPLCTLALTALAVQAGIPPNVIQVVTTKDMEFNTAKYFMKFQHDHLSLSIVMLEISGRGGADRPARGQGSATSLLTDYYGSWHEGYTPPVRLLVAQLGLSPVTNI